MTVAMTLGERSEKMGRTLTRTTEEYNAKGELVRTQKSVETEVDMAEAMTLPSPRIADFHKVSFEQFAKAMNECQTADAWSDAVSAYDALILPKRATSGSAGYDFYAPFAFTLNPGESIRIPTGIRAEMQRGWCLVCAPRSGLGVRYRLRLDNTIGIIDSDYYYSANEGHILAQITNCSSDQTKTLAVKAGEAFMQGVFLQYGITRGDDAKGIRNGGFGSTNQ